MLFALLTGLFPASALARINGEFGTHFELTARADVISTSDGDSMWMWSWRIGTRQMRFPGPTLIVEGDGIAITLDNALPVPVSLVFPGLDVNSTGGTAGLLARQVGANGAGGPALRPHFVATDPGTYSYYGGWRPELSVEMQ